MARMQPMAKSKKANKIIAARAISRDPAATNPPSVDRQRLHHWAHQPNLMRRDLK